MTSPQVGTLAQLSETLASGCSDVATFFATLTPEELRTHRPGEWSPVDDLEHLCLSVEPVLRSLGMSAEELTGRFGTATRPSVTFEELKARYLARLAEGVKAPPRFVPAEGSEAAPADRRNDLLARWAELGGRLQGALSQWREEDLERCQLPHPALGTLTMREMLLFTHLHNRHHIDVARRRLERAAI